MDNNTRDINSFHDPDFDAFEEEQSEVKDEQERLSIQSRQSVSWFKVLHQLPPKIAFFLGLGVSVMVPIVVGFFLLLWLLVGRPLS